MKNGLLLGLDSVGKTLLLRQLSAQLSKNHKSVLEKLVALAAGVSAATGLTSKAASVSGYGGLSTEDLSDPQPSAAAGLQVARETQPTIGVEHTNLALDARTAVICEVGGQLLPMWKAYFASCDFWVFVVDISNPTQVAGSAIEFFNILSHETMRKKPKLLLLNKMDAGFTLEDTLLRSYLKLDQLMSGLDGCLLHVVKVSAATGENMDAVIKWLVQRWGSQGSFSSSTRHVLGPHHQGLVAASMARNDSRVHPVAVAEK